MRANKSETETIFKLILAIFSEQLYDGIRGCGRGGVYGLCEAARHWRIAQQDPGAYAEIVGVESFRWAFDYLANRYDLKNQLEVELYTRLLEEYPDVIRGTGAKNFSKIPCEALDQIAELEEKEGR